MANQLIDLDSFALDSLGRVILSDELLDRVRGEVISPLAGGYTNEFYCSGTWNGSCSNLTSCGSSSNAGCTNNFECRGSSNGSCR